MAEVFISYAREDRGFAGDLQEFLEEAQRSAWIDWSDIPDGAEWPPAIFAAIEAADNFLFIISPDSLRSEMCRKEVNHAVKNGKRIVTILYHPVESKDLFPGVDTVEWLSYPDLKSKKTFEKLLAALNDDREWVRQHTELGSRAKAWDTRSRHNDYLLRGIELRDAIGWLEQAATIETQQPTELQRQYIRTSEEWEKETERQRQELERRTAVPGERREEIITSRLEEEDWIFLIDRIKQGNVIPVIGRDLIRVPFEGKLVTYERYVAWQLAQRPEYSLTDEDLKPLGVTLEQATLDDVISVCIKKQPAEWPIGLHLHVWEIVNKTQLPVPAALTQLAQITDFDLFVTTTFDHFLEQALGAQGLLATGTYQGRQDDDLGDLLKSRREGRRLLYYLFGKAYRGSYDFAINKVELRRLSKTLSKSNYRPRRLFDEIHENHLLLMGVPFDDYFAETFLGLARESGPLNREQREYFVSPRMTMDFALSLGRFSGTTKVAGIEPEEFVAELHQRWSAEAPNISPPVAPEDSWKPPQVQRVKAASTSPAAKVQPAIPITDVERPYPGLLPFTEEQHSFFFGRADEVEDLFDCVKRDTVTLLYSQSGVGKSSLLQAGLFPLLRRARFLPVYVRLRYDEAIGSLESQVKAALHDAIYAVVDGSGFGAAASPVADESLWEYLHRRGGNLTDRDGYLVSPVLVFDQFEEIFTMGENNENARQLRAQFVTCLADLAENSIPRELGERLADNPKLAEQLDFASTGCKFVVALREEYVPHLDDLRKIPSLAFTSSRVRLKQMNGEQALRAVSMPAPELLTDEVAENIVRFVAVAGEREGKPLRDLEVAPAILSLFCQALNNKRVGSNLPQVTNDLVMGSAGTVIDDFYHSCVNDKPAAVQRLIEDKLVTETGYRNSIDLTDAKMQLERAGVHGSVIDELVDKRALRIEDYRGQLRLELTHDVLLEPVKRCREQRRLRMAQERAGSVDAKEEGRSAFWTRLVRALKAKQG